MSVIIRLQGLPLSAGISEVRSFFSGLRIPDGAVHIVGGTEGDVFVGFASDEDARQAMLNSGLLIHGSKIRLLLSSRTEMNSVIQQARAAAMGGIAVMSAPAPAPVAPKPAPETPRYEAAYARAEPPVYKQTNTPVNPSTHSGGYTGWGQRAAPVEEPTPPVKPDPIPSASDPVFPPIYKRDVYASANQSERDAPSLRYDAGPRRDPLLDAAIAPHVDASAHHAHAYEREREHTRADQSYNGAKWTMDDMRWPDDTAGMRSVNMNQRPAEGSAYNERPRYEEVRGGRNGHENGGRQDDGYISKLASSAERYDAKREAPIYAQERENNPNHPVAQAAYEPSSQQGFFNKPVSVPQKPYELPPSSSDNGVRQFFPTAQPCKPIPPPPMPVYVELSRLPPDLMRPANLELFIRPKTPLTLTSLKVVYGVGGLHLYTLVRLANESDALTLLARDGERGVRVMRSNKKAFDEANDGLGALPPVVPNLKMQSQMPRRVDREREERDRRRRSRSRSPLRGRGGERNGRWRGARRSRSPRRSPRRSRSPRHSSQQPDDPHRHCVVMTNLPYKISDKEIKDWLAGSELIPTSLRRSFYEDGQASDRWIVEFDSPALVDRLYEHRQRISDRLARFLRLRRVPNREADELLAIPDKFGEERKKETESQLLKDAGLIEPLKFGAFSTPVFAGTGQHNRTDRGGYMDDAAPAMKPQPPVPVPTPLMAAGVGARPPPMPLLDAVVSFFGGRGGGRGGAAMPRGALAMRGGMGAPRRGGLLGTSNGGGINPLGGPLTCVVLKNAPDDNLEVMCLVDAGQGAVLEKASDGTVYVELGSVEAAAAVTRKHGQLVRGRPLHVACMSRAQMDFELRQGGTGGGGGGAAPAGRADADRQLASDLAQFGCVLTCDGFPPQTTLEDILHFFADVPVARDTIRMRMNDVGVPTGECMLAVRGQSAAERAVRSLSGRTFHGSSIRVRIVQ